MKLVLRRSCFSCFDGGCVKQERLEEERRASDEARAKASEAAENSDLAFMSIGPHCLNDCVGRKEIHRQEQFAQSVAGRAARAQMQAAAKQASHTNKDEPTLKVHVVRCQMDGSLGWAVYTQDLLYENNIISHRASTSRQFEVDESIGEDINIGAYFKDLYTCFDF